MKCEFSKEHGKPCVHVKGTESFGEVVMCCLEFEAIVEDGTNLYYVVQFEGYPPDLYSGNALSLRLGAREA